MQKGSIQDEATGVYIGTLQEDMIDTISREKKMYCNVLIPEFYTDKSNYPLTYVPLWAMSLDLKKGDKVMVTFNQENLMHPILYKNPSEIDKGFYDRFDLANINMASEPTICATRFGDDSYIVKTKSYTVFHQNGGFVLLDDKNNVYVYGRKVNIVSSKGMSIRDDKGNDLLKIIKDIILKLNTKVTVTEAVITPSQFVKELTDIQTLIGV